MEIVIWERIAEDRTPAVLMMIDEEKTRFIGTRIEEEQKVITMGTLAGDEFEVERPAVSENTEKLLLDQIREIVADDTESEGA